MTDEVLVPAYEKMTELDVPGMIHVHLGGTRACTRWGWAYLNADTTVFMQLVQGDLFGVPGPAAC